MKAVWVTDYDMHEDKCYKAPGCPECKEPIGRYNDGKYRCFSCGKIVEPDEKMNEWFKVRDERKTEYQDCTKLAFKDGKTFGCGGKGCMEVHYMRNPITLEWQTAGGVCKNCGMRFIV